MELQLKLGLGQQLSRVFVSVVTVCHASQTKFAHTPSKSNHLQELSDCEIWAVSLPL